MTTENGQVIVEFDVPAPMRDGTVLRADVYRPAAPGVFPTLLLRTPYGKRTALEIRWNGIDPVEAARRGFMVVIQDARGRFTSDGEWHPLGPESEDGYDSVEWAATLPGSNGSVGMFGGSYCGNTQWRAAGLRPPALKAITPLMTWADPRDGLTARGGAAELGLELPWSLLTSIDDVERHGLSEEEAFGQAMALIEAYDALADRGYWELPVPSDDVLSRADLGDIRLLSSYVADAELPSSLAEVPSLHTGGWYDIFLQGTLDNYAAMTARGLPARLVVGPWAHDGFEGRVGERVFGLLATRDGAPVHPYGDWKDYQLAWLRHQLVSGDDAELPETPVRIFVMGRNEWRDEPEWPLTRAQVQPWFLHAGGELSSEPPPEASGVSAFRYDPADPVPVAGGNTVMWLGFVPGPLDQRNVEARSDVLVFTSAPLEKELEVTGRVNVVLHARSSAPATDWVARLCDVAPDGTSLNLCDGIFRMTGGADDLGRYEIDLWSTSNVFLAGHRIRVQVTSSCFPRWDRNLNTGDQRGTAFQVAHQTIHHSIDRASYVELPVIPASQ